MQNENKEQGNSLTFRYKFIFEDRTEKTFEINLDAATLNYIPLKNLQSPPNWTKLNYARCENCTLDQKQCDYCPIALNFIDLFDFFKSLYSYDKTEVVIDTAERTYYKKTTVQRGLGSMLGIYMVTSGCPVMEVLKPMVRFHLPFASIEDTVFKAASTYLLGQYFSLKKGLSVDFTLDQLREFYLEIQKVNQGIVKRLRPIIKKDAFANAIISLDAFAKELPWSIEDQLENLEYLYSGYF